MSDVEDLFYSRTVQFAFHRTRLDFDLARSVFASANIDPGSALLLRYLQTLDLTDVGRVLDVGCGHGTLGIVLKALDRERRVTFVDRDALACRYTTRNLRLNNLLGDEPLSGPDDAENHDVVLGSLGYDELTGVAPFDLVVSNIPGKVGAPVIEHLVQGAAAFAGPGSLVGFVIVNPLAEELRALMTEPGLELLVNKGNKTHEVFIARVVDQIAIDDALRSFDRGVYDRNADSFDIRDLSWRARTVAGIDEFDNLAQPTRLLRQALQGVKAGPSTVMNPGQGHRGAIAAKAGYPPATLISRDLLALRASDRCLDDSGITGPRNLVHDIGLTPELIDSAALTILHADDKVHGPWLTNEVTRYLDHVAGADASDLGERHLVLSGRSGILGRLEADLLNRRPGHVAYKKGVKGHRIVRFVPKQKR